MGEAQKITVNGDEILAKHKAWAAGESSDASNSGKRREAIGAYAEKCGLENKALSQFRAGLKIKSEGKRKDWLRSMQMLLPVAEREIFDNEPDLPMGNPNAEEQQKAAAAMVADQSNEMAEEHGAGDGDPDLDQDAADFDQHADEVDGDNVEPIDFSGKAAE